MTTLRVSASVDYAVRAAIQMARNGDSPLSVADIAQREDIPIRFLAATVAILRRSGLVNSRRGGSGGYWLARPADEISLLDIAEAIEGSAVDLSTVGDTTSAHWGAVELATCSAMRALTLDEMAATPEHDCLPSPANPAAVTVLSDYEPVQAPVPVRTPAGSI